MRLLLACLILIAVIPVAATHATAAEAYCTVESTYIVVAGRGVTTPSVTVPCP